MKRLNGFQYFKDFFRPDVGRDGNLVNAGLEVRKVQDSGLINRRNFPSSNSHVVFTPEHELTGFRQHKIFEDF